MVGYRARVKGVVGVKGWWRSRGGGGVRGGSRGWWGSGVVGVVRV